MRRDGYSAGGRRPTLADAVLTFAWFGAVVGVIEGGAATFRRLALDRITFAHSEIFWVAPAANMLVFAVIGAVAGLACCWTPERRAFSWLTAGAASIAFFSLGLLVPRIHRIALLPLALGLGMQASRFAATRADRFRSIVRRSLPAIAGLVLATALAVRTWHPLAERWALRRLPDAPAGAPNILLIIWDTVRAASTSLHGGAKATTPFLEELARSGVLLRNAIAPSSWTLPSHASIFTGRHAHELSVDWLAPLVGERTLAEVLRAHGYATAAFVANKPYASRETGLARGFLHFEDYGLAPGDLLLSSGLAALIVDSPTLRRLIGAYEVLGRKTAEQINGDFLRWLSDRGQRPWFGFLNYYDAHQPVLPPAPFDSMVPARVRRLDMIRHFRHEACTCSMGALSPEELEAEVRAYEAAIS